VTPGGETVINWNYHSAISVAKRPKTKGHVSAYIQASLLKWGKSCRQFSKVIHE
jgi:hypothetical protein